MDSSGDRNVLNFHSISVQILIMIMYYNSVKCCNWRVWVKSTGTLSIISYYYI